MTRDIFRDKFRFNPALHLYLGIERESFFVNDGAIVADGPRVIPHLLAPDNAYGYELSACQLELRTAPTHINDLPRTLLAMDERLYDDERRLRFHVEHREVAPFDMPLDIYPDPTGRYQAITATMPIDVIRAACQVAGTHVHVGMASHELALKAYNAAVHHVMELCAAGDHSHGQRLEIYKIVKPALIPPTYDSWDAYESYAKEHGFYENPRNCWHLIRISAHGTIEFRMFGATPLREEILAWATRCYDICKSATE